jgi:S-methylmethionine-dependent homocysteine/selenocysteine methylase
MPESTLPLPDRLVLLDGGMGRELRLRGVPMLNTIWSATALITAPEIVRQVHIDFIEAGADVITTNSYGVVRTQLAKEEMEQDFEALNGKACELALQAREAAGRDVLIAGSLPPLHGSLDAALSRPFAEIEPLYREQAEILAPQVDLFLCETMCCAEEAAAAATAAASTGRPVWVSWSLQDDGLARLRSGETVGEAAARLADLPVAALLANCCTPESIAAAMPALRTARPDIPFGGYANAIANVPQGWTLDGSPRVGTQFAYREDLEPGAYAGHVAGWVERGARIIGGCCGIGPAHIARLRRDFIAG